MSRKVVVGLVQGKWESDATAYKENILKSIKEAALQSAQIVFLQELTLHRYFGDKEKNDPEVLALAEELDKGPTAQILREGSKANNVFVVGSLFERYEKNGSAHYYNTAVIYNTKGELHAFTRKQHIPSGTGYNETYFFESGDSDYPVHDLGFIKLAIPTCYDQWFPELARIYALKGAELILSPPLPFLSPLSLPSTSSTSPHSLLFNKDVPYSYRFRAKLSYPRHPTNVANHDVMQLQMACLLGQLIELGLKEPLLFTAAHLFVLQLEQAPRDAPQILAVTLDFGEFELWRQLFPLLTQRQPATYSEIVKRS